MPTLPYFPPNTELPGRTSTLDAARASLATSLAGLVQRSCIPLAVIHSFLYSLTRTRKRTFAATDNTLDRLIQLTALWATTLTNNQARCLAGMCNARQILSACVTLQATARQLKWLKISHVVLHWVKRTA